MLADEKVLFAVSDLCGELDWSAFGLPSLLSSNKSQMTNHLVYSLLALAHGASQDRLTRPRITDENVISIVAGQLMLSTTPS